MDQILKARKLASATARRKRMQEREAAMVQDEERRLRILLYGYSSEEDESPDDEENSYSPILDAPAYRPRPTSRQSTARNYPSGPSSESSSQQPPRRFPLASAQSSKPSVPELIIPPPISSPFKPCQVKPWVLEGEADQSPLIAGSESPVEIATPILYSIPRVRPSLISIKTSICSTDAQELHQPVSMPQSPAIPARSPRRISAMTVRSAGSSTGSQIVSRPSFAGPPSNDVENADQYSVRRRPVTVSVKSELALQHQGPSYDVFPRRSKMTNSGKTDQPTTSEARSRATAPAAHRNVLSTQCASSSPTTPREPQRTAAVIPQSGLETKKPSSTLRQRRSSIGLALRNASSSLRGKKANDRPATSGSSGSVGSNREIDITAFPRPPSLPLLRQSVERETKSPGTSSGSLRLRGPRAMVRF